MTTSINSYNLTDYKSAKSAKNVRVVGFDSAVFILRS